MSPGGPLMENEIQPQEGGDLLRFNDDGRLVLIESNLSQFKLLFFALFFTVLLASSLWYWFESISGHLTPFYENNFRTPAIVGPFLAPLVWYSFVLSFFHEN